jgi:2-amino-4-hydroxy-6-hydroxymethyldihydropteridine diphosphokinase
MMNQSEVSTHIAYLSVGSNIGDKRFNCETGISTLADTDQINVVDQSSYYRTEPVDYENQDWFVNCVVKLRTALSPAALFKILQRVELQAGRSKKGVRFGPRVLDMDILLYDACILVSPELIIPHPRMHKRRFVLGPFCDINSNVVHPVLKKTIQDLLARIDAETQRIVPY